MIILWTTLIGVEAHLFVINVLATGFMPQQVTIQPGDGVQFLSMDSANAHRIVCNDTNAPYNFESNPLTSSGGYYQIGVVTALGVFPFYDLNFPTHTGSFTVAPLNPQVVVVNVSANCAYPAATTIYVGDTLAIHNTDTNSVQYRVYANYPSTASADLAAYGAIAAAGVAYVNTTAEADYFQGGFNYSLSCSPTPAAPYTPGLLIISFSRTPTTDPPTPVPVNQTPQPPVQAPTPGQPQSPTPGNPSPNSPTPSAGGQPSPSNPSSPTPPNGSQPSPTPAGGNPVTGPGSATPAPIDSAACASQCSQTCIKTGVAVSVSDSIHLTIPTDAMCTHAQSCDCTVQPFAAVCMAPTTAKGDSSTIRLSVAAMSARVIVIITVSQLFL